MGGELRAEAAMPCMKSRDEIRKEVSTPMESLATPKHQVRVAAWNVRTMYESGRTAQVVREMERYKVNLLGVSEMRWTDSGILTLNSGHTVCYSGRTDGQHQEGVGIIMDKTAKKSFLGWEPINHRIIRARFYSRFAKTTIIQCYAPTDPSEDEEKDLFYSQLQEQIDRTPRHDILIVMGDLNAKVGADNVGYESCMGREGVGEMTDNGQRFADMCLENGLVIGGTVFRHKTIHKLTWTSPDGRTNNQIDHITINQKWRRSMTDVRVIRGADVSSDHHLVLCKLRVKLKRTTKRTSQLLFDSSKLKDLAVKTQFVLELNNRFQVLADTPAEDVDTLCDNMQKMFIDISADVLGHRRREKKEWISQTTWQLIEERRTAKQRMLGGSKEDKATAAETYREKNVAVKKSARRDKREYTDSLAREAQSAAERGDTRTVYKITKTLTGGFTSKSTVVKDKEGKVLMKEDDQLNRWAEHFKETLNRPDPEEEETIEDTGFHIEMKRGRITRQEITEAIRQTKGNRAPGEDRITADMLKADPATSARVLEELFNRVWEEEKVPETWKKGIIVKLPKKGDLSVCGNWRGINLLSVPGKIFCRVLLQRMRQTLERILREEQAGFRSGRGCIDQIFVLRTIVEQSLEWNSSLYVNYIDFEKAFDSIHHPSLWKILEAYGFPSKVINILKDMYADNQCCVRHEGQQSEWFHVKTGVRQGCVISPVLFLVVIDWVMRQATKDRPRGLVWGLTARLEDCDFADDIALLSHTQKDIQEKTDRVNQTAKSVGLKIHADKTKLMKLKNRSTKATTVHGQELEEVQHFKYLGSYISADSNIEKEITTRIGLAAQAFNRLQNIWRSSVLQTNTKLKIYKSNVRSVLLYASETWRTNKKIESRLRGFEGRCLRRILRIHWEQRVTNQEVSRRTGINNIVDEVKKRRWRWLGHVLRMNKTRHPLAALRWAPPGKRKRGRALGTWRRTMEEEMKVMGKTWNELSWLAQDRDVWRRFVGASCSSGSEED